jgi:serine/threonine-protein kinase
MLTAHVYVEPAPLLPMFQVPDYVTTLCNRCLAKDPTERPSAREAAALLAHGAGLPVVTDEPSVQAQAAIDPSPSVLIRASGQSPAVAAALAVPQPPAQPEDAPGDPAGPPRPDDDALAGPPADSGPADARPADAGSVGLPPGPGDEAAEPASARRKRMLYALVAVVLLGAVAATLWLLPPARQQAAVSAPAPGPDPTSPAASRAAANPPPGAPATPTAGPGRSGVINPAPADAAPGPAVPGDPAPEEPGPTATTPVTEGPEPTPTTTTPPPEPIERTLTSDAGSVRATCPSADTAQILSWTATKPYKVVEGDTEAGPSPAVSFKHGNRQLTMTVTCNRGVPSATSA